MKTLKEILIEITSNPPISFTTITQEILNNFAIERIKELSGEDTFPSFGESPFQTSIGNNFEIGDLRCNCWLMVNVDGNINFKFFRYTPKEIDYISENYEYVSEVTERFQFEDGLDNKHAIVIRKKNFGNVKEHPLVDLESENNSKRRAELERFVGSRVKGDRDLILERGLLRGLISDKSHRITNKNIESLQSPLLTTMGCECKAGDILAKCLLLNIQEEKFTDFVYNNREIRDILNNYEIVADVRPIWIIERIVKKVDKFDSLFEKKKQL